MIFRSRVIPRTSAPRSGALGGASTIRARSIRVLLAFTFAAPLSSCQDPISSDDDLLGSLGAAVPPTLRLNSPQPESEWDGLEVTIAGNATARDSIVSAEYILNGGAPVSFPLLHGRWIGSAGPGSPVDTIYTVSFDLRVPALPGRNEVSVRLEDRRGNQATSEVRPFTATRALFSISSPRDGLVTNTSPLTLHANSARPFLMRYSLDGGPEADLPTWVHHGIHNYAIAIDVPEGTHTLDFIARDDTMELSRRSVGFTYVNTPRIALGTIDRTRLGVDTVTIRGGATTPHGVAAISYRVNGGAPTEVPVTSATSAAFSFVARLPAYGPNSIRVIAADTRGVDSSVVVVVSRQAGPEVPGAFASVSAGQEHSCGLTPAGVAYCWGSNAHGELGAGAVQGSLVPVEVVGGHRFSSIRTNRAPFPGAGSNSFSCGIVTSGELYCWGEAYLGQFGSGEQPFFHRRTVPTLAFGGRSFAHYALGARHTCGATADGDVWCAGANEEGQLGNGSTSPFLGTGSPNPTPNRVQTDLRFGALTAGRAHTCALTDVGAAYCWGSNGQGQLGSEGPNAGAPRAVEGGVLFRTLTAGADFTCGISTGGDTYCWGANDLGQLGVGDGTPRSQPTPVSGNLRFTDLAAGVKHACGLASGRAFCWGQPPFQPSFGSTPRPIAGEAPPFVGISSGKAHSCALAENGAAYCWGEGRGGVLGDGLELSSATPVRVTDP